MDDVRSGDRPDGWALALSDEPIIAAKSQANQLPFAVLLAFFRTHGRFPRPQEEIDPEAVAELAWRIGMTSAKTLAVSERTLKRHRAEIRPLLGFREATVADGVVLTAWLRDHAVAVSRDMASEGRARTALPGH